MEKRERLGSRLGFILLSAGCAIGCGNVWMFPWLTGQNGGGSFVFVYILCVILLGLPVMTVEFALGRASQASPVKMLGKLPCSRPGLWNKYGILAFIGNIALMGFYTTVAGWMLYFFKSYAVGQTSALSYAGTKTDPKVSTIYMIIVCVIGFGILVFKLQNGLEKISKYIMSLLFIIMLMLVVHSFTLKGARDGLSFYLKPDFSKINGNVIVAAMNQAFFSLSCGIGSMAIFGSYIDKKRSLLGESINIASLDTLAALLAGLIIFPACYTFGIEPDAGPGLLFDTMTKVFNQMEGGRFWGTLFFLFMSFAALSTVLAVFENILAMTREITGWSRLKGAIICGIAMIAISITSSLSYSVLGNIHPFSAKSAIFDVWDVIVNTFCLPLGSVIITLFASYKIGWGWDNFVKEANEGSGIKVQNWMKPIFKYLVPIVVIVLFVYGVATYSWH